MDRERWSNINRIFHGALGVDPSQRHAFVATESNGDRELQREVELLLLADAEGGSFLDTPLISENFLSPHAPVSVGDVLCGRFRIVHEIGEGGMGYVFEAFDSELSVPVAVKMIRPELAPNREAIARFRQEVRLALTITHPNVCRTFDIQRDTRIVEGKRTELVFLTMELLRGETLSARIRRDGKLQVPVALDFACQIASALRAARSLGVIHRDMKPANIMLVKPVSVTPVGPASTSEDRTRVVVMDFGLARVDPLLPDPGHTAFSRTGNAIGTLTYMAPEQLEAGPVSLSTDMYSFGLILFEMMAGEPAFPSDSLLSGIAKRLNGSIALKKLQSPDIRPNWRRAIEWCLATDPSHRPKDVDAVIELLEGGRRWFLPRRKGPYSLFRHSVYRIYSGVAAILVIVALLAGGLRLYESRADSKVTPGALVYLTPVKNETGEKSLDNLTELIQAGLSQSTQVNLLDRARVGDILQQMTKSPDSAIDPTTEREIAMRAGAIRVILATVSGSNGSYKLAVDIQQPDNIPTRYRGHWTKNIPWQSSGSTVANNDISPELQRAVRDTSDWVRYEVGESAKDIATLNVPPGEVTTSSWPALTEFADAQRLEAEGRKEQSIAAYRRSIAADPNFSLAYAHLADLLVSDDKRIEGYQAYLKALNEDTGSRLTRKERDFIAGSYATDTKDFESSLAAFRDYSAYYPNDFSAWYYQAYPLQMLGRPAEALEAALRADAVMGTSHPGGNEIAYIYMTLGQNENVRKWIAIIRQRGNSELALYLESLVSFLEGQYDDCERLLSQLQHSPQKKWVGFGFFTKARIQAERGDSAGALLTLAQEEIDLGPVGKPVERAALALDRAYLLCRSGSFERCVADVNAAVGLESSPDTILTASDVLGTFIPSMSSHATAQALLALQHMQSQLAGEKFGVIDDLAQRRLAGEIALASGRPQGALLHFRKADALEAPFRARDYLARCLLSAASSESNPGTALQMKEEALAVYGRTALQLASVWRKPRDYPPGFAADTMENYVRLAKSLHHADAGEASVEAMLKKLRPHSVALRDRP